MSVPTQFILQGFDQRVRPQYQDTVSVTLIHTGSSKDDDFLFACDSIAGSGFDPVTGGYYVDVNTAIRIPDNFVPQTPIYFGGFLVATSLRITSFVLVYEPPVAQDNLPGPASYPRMNRLRVNENSVFGRLARKKLSRSGTS